MKPSRDSELEQFKTQIDLREYAASVGFELVRRQSSRHSAVMKHVNGDKLVITRTSSRHYVYFNVHGGDSGSIVDFVQTRDRGSLGDVRKTLRGWNGSTLMSDGSANPPPLFPELLPSSHDAARVLAAWIKAEPIRGVHDYLQHERGIPPSTLADPIFAERIRVDKRGNAVFPHYDRSGLCGFELKNRGFTGFSPGGIKGLMYSRPLTTDLEMVVCETGIDLLSVAALEGTARRRFYSLAGQPSPAQISLLQSAAERMPQRSRLVLAFDNDQPGRNLAKLVRSALQPLCLGIIEHLPAREGQDWNDVLKARSAPIESQFRTVVSPSRRSYGLS